MERLISGIQPTGRLHLGNYLGALANFVHLQKSSKYERFFFIADYHSLSENYDPDEKRKQILEIGADFLAIGLDPKKSTIFLQSDIPETTELASILNNVTPFGDLLRMTQFKDKANDQKDNINAGLFNYPVLMTADILLYDAKIIPIGDDQMQHLELARTIARRFNSRFGKTFTEPNPLLTDVPRLMSLDNPDKKMSKSSPKGCVYIDDEPDIVCDKFKGAVTDSGSEVKFHEGKQAISNLLVLFSALSGKTVQQIERDYVGVSYSQFKMDLADLVVDYFAPYRAAKKDLMKNPSKIKKMLVDGAKKARPIAKKKMAEVKKKIGVN